MPPRVRGGLVGAADVLTMSTNRLLLRDQPLAREYGPEDIAPDFPTWGQTNPDDEEYQRHRREGFRDWRLPVGGLVGRPTSFSLDDIRRLPSRTQITAHVCEQGWSAIAEWTGAPLLQVLDAAGGLKPEARYVMLDTVDGWYEGIDLFEVVHPQTILAWGLNGGRPARRQRRPPAAEGRAPVRLQEPEVPEVHPGRGLHGRLRPGHRRHQLRLGIPLVRRRVERVRAPIAALARHRTARGPGRSAEPPREPAMAAGCIARRLQRGGPVRHGPRGEPRAPAYVGLMAAA